MSEPTMDERLPAAEARVVGLPVAETATRDERLPAAEARAVGLPAAETATRDERLPAAEARAVCLPAAETATRDERLPAAEARVVGLPATSPYLDIQSEITIATGDLPHWHQDDKLQFVTFRLADSLPQTKIAFLKQEIARFTASHPLPWNEEVKKAYWKIIGPLENRLLDNGYGSCILKDPSIRKILSDAILFHDGDKYYVLSFVIMPNHVHMLIQPKGDTTIMEVMHSIKSFTANQINKALGRTGPLWKKEYFDRMIRSESHLRKCLDYIRDNPKNLCEGEYQIYFASAAGSPPSEVSAAGSSPSGVSAAGSPPSEVSAAGSRSSMTEGYIP